MKSITVQSVVTQVNGFVTAAMGDEKVMLSVEHGTYFNLGEIGGAIWEAIEQPTTVGAVVDRFVASYEVERDMCESDVLNFLESLYQEGMITVDA
ncbi:MAG: lasso peptide biosynthesis PqqD family chaperone [Bacilli bacterium]